MTVAMAERIERRATIRLVVEVSEETHAALKQEALDRGKPWTMGQIIDEMTEAHLPDALERIRERRKPPENPRPKR